MICEAVIIIGERIIQLMVREARKEDLDALLKLYLFLHEDSIPELNAHLEKTWNQIIEDPNHHLIVKVFIEPNDIVIESEPEFPARMAFCFGPLGEEIEFFREM